MEEQVDQISYGLIMQELERGLGLDYSIVQSSLVMFPIYKYGTEAQRKNIYQN